MKNYKKNSVLFGKKNRNYTAYFNNNYYNDNLELILKRNH